ncbi:trypsin-like peptidase domain-containing protein [Planctomycetota bacterium]
MVDFNRQYAIAVISNVTCLNEKLVRVIEKHGFIVNPEKTRHRSIVKRQEVTGITVNEFPNLPRNYVRSIHGALYAWETFGLKMANSTYLSKYAKRNGAGNIGSWLKGSICYLKMVLGDNSSLYRKIVKRFNTLSPKDPISIPLIELLKPCPLTGKPSKTSWNHWFKKYENSICFLQAKNNEGDNVVATGFYIGPSAVATANHNLKYKHIELWQGDEQLEVNESYPSYSTEIPDVGILDINLNFETRNTWIPTQMRLPEIGEEVTAIGFPSLPQRRCSIVMHIGIVESLPVSYSTNRRYVQFSFQSGGGLSGAPLIDKKGYAVGVMVENVFLKTSQDIPQKAYGQAVPIEYLWDLVHYQKQYMKKS